MPINRKIFTPLPLVESEAELAAVQNLVGKFGPRGGMVFWEDGQEFVKIPLTQGQFALIDSADYEDVGRFRWHAYRGCRTWYSRRGLNMGSDDTDLIQMHQQILSYPGDVIDHKNLNGLDNRRRNLRVTDGSHNSQNGLARKGRVFKGTYQTPYGRWTAQIRVLGACWYLGTHESEIEAARAYDIAAIQLFGADARINFPLSA